MPISGSSERSCPPRSIPNPKFMFLLEDDSAMCCEIVECRDWNDTYRLCIVARCAHHSLFESVDDTIALLCSPLITKIRNTAKMISAPLCPTCAVPKRLGKHPMLSVPELSQLAQRKNIEPRQTTCLRSCLKIFALFVNLG